MAEIQYTPITDEDYNRVVHDTAARHRMEPRLQKVKYDKELGHLRLELIGGTTVQFPARSLQSFRDATDDELGDARVVAKGSAVHWNALDVQMTTVALLQLVLNLKTAQEVARQAGRTVSAAKAHAARINGTKGGRPRRKLAGVE